MQYYLPWWRHQMETFSALLAICAGNSPVDGEFSSQRQVTRSFDVFFHLCLNKRLSEQLWGWWYETLSHSLWCHCNAYLLEIPGLYSLSGKTSYCEIAWRLGSREIGCHDDLITVKFDRYLGSAAAEMPIIFQSDLKNLNLNLAALRLHKILWWDVSLLS